MANSFGASTETAGISTQTTTIPATTARMSYSDNLRRIVTGKTNQPRDTFSDRQKKEILDSTFTTEKFKAVEQVEKAKDKIADDIEREINLIHDLHNDLKELGWNGKNEEMSSLMINTLLEQAQKQVYTKLRTGKFATDFGIGEAAAGADIISRGIEMGAGYHIGATHDAIDKFWDTTKLDYVPVLGGLASSLSHIVGSIYNNLAVNAFGKESDDEKLERLKDKLQGAERRIQGFVKDTKRLEIQADNFINNEKTRYNKQRGRVESILNSKGQLSRSDEAYLNLEKYRDFY